MLRSKLQKWKKFSSLPTLRLQIWIILNSYSPSSNNVILTVGQAWGCILPFPTVVLWIISIQKHRPEIGTVDGLPFGPPSTTVHFSPLLVQFIFHGHWAMDRPLWPFTVNYTRFPKTKIHSIKISRFRRIQKFIIVLSHNSNLEK